MDPFRDYPQAAAAPEHCRPSARCAVCSARTSQLSGQFYAIVREVWSPAERDLLARAARAALLRNQTHRKVPMSRRYNSAASNTSVTGQTQDG
jgi:hypothetical protein